jgi:16S rRNA processing protein RimM
MGDDRVPDDLVTLGRIVGLFGTQGWVKVYSYTRPPESILQYDPWLIRSEGEWRNHRLKGGRRQGKGLVAHLEQCPTREEANRLIGADIAVPLERLPALPEGEYYWVQLEGLQVVNLENVTLGVVSHLLETGANDVMVVVPQVSLPGEGAQANPRLIPYVAEVVREVDLERGFVRVDWGPDY